MKLNDFNKFLVAFILLTTATPVFSQAPNKLKVVSYYSGSGAVLDSFNVNQMTDIIFCFGHLDGNKFKLRRAADTATIKKMVSLKAKNPDLKVLISLGGWGGCETCSDVFSSAAGRKEFAQSIKSLYNYFHIDGLDLDWEYPGISGYPGHKHKPEDKQNFTALVKEVRKLGHKYQLTFAAGGSQRYLDSAIEWKKVMKKVDYCNIMSYDLSGGGKANHHTPLLSSPNQPRSADFMVKSLIAMGIPARKLIIGGAFYGKIFEGVENVNNGLFQPGKLKSAGGSVNYKAIPTTLTAAAGWEYHWDEASKAPYMYNPTLKQFYTYDDKRSIAEKTKYVIDNKLGGIMFWQLGGDTYKNGLLNEINTVKQTYVSSK
jgi:chitinase